MNLARGAALLALVLASCGAPAVTPRSPSPLLGQWYFDATQPGKRGGTASVTIHGSPSVQCTALFLWPKMPRAGQSIPAATTDASGTAVLRWPVDPATPAGSWRIDATCGGQTLSTHVPIE
jgi:hypothetical protein